MTLHIDLTQKRGSAKDLALEPDERDKLYQTLKDKKDRIIFLLGAYAGLRAEEISQCRFTWLEWGYFKDCKVLMISIPLEDKSTRKQTYKDGKRKNAKFSQKKEWKTVQFIFNSEIANEIYYYYEANPNGLMISRQSITQIRVAGRTKEGKFIKGHFSKIIDRHITTHALRSTYTNYMTQEFRFPNGEKPDPMFIKTQLRHKDLRTTMKHYKTENKAQQLAYLKGVLEN